MARKISEVMLDNSVSFDDFYTALRDSETVESTAYWDGIHDREMLINYGSEQAKTGFKVAHIFNALDKNGLETDYFSWDSTAGMFSKITPINTKAELLDALFLDGDDLDIEI